jgi:hypothetical protein
MGGLGVLPGFHCVSGSEERPGFQQRDLQNSNVAVLQVYKEMTRAYGGSVLRGRRPPDYRVKKFYNTEWTRARGTSQVRLGAKKIYSF